MGLNDVQYVLARLLTEAELRARFLADPAALGNELNLNIADIALLTTFSQPQVERNARSLQAKRWGEIEKLLPLSIQVAQSCRIPLFTLFQTFARTFVPTGGKRHAQDAIAFAEWAGSQPISRFTGKGEGGVTSAEKEGSFPKKSFLLGSFQEGSFQEGSFQEGSFPLWLPDLLRYEAAWLAANLDTRRRFLQIRRFRYPVYRIGRLPLQNLAASSLDRELEVRTTWIVWFRLSRKRSHPVVSVLPSPGRSFFARRLFADIS